MRRRSRLLAQRQSVAATVVGASAGVVVPEAVGAGAFVQQQAGTTLDSTFAATWVRIDNETRTIGPFQVERCTVENDGVLFADHPPFWRVLNTEAYVRATGYSLTARDLEDISADALVWRDGYLSPTWYVLTAPQVRAPAPGEPTPPAGGGVSKGSSSGVVVAAAFAAALLLGGDR